MKVIFKRRRIWLWTVWVAIELNKDLRAFSILLEKKKNLNSISLLNASLFCDIYFMNLHIYCILTFFHEETRGSEEDDRSRRSTVYASNGPNGDD